MNAFRKTILPVVVLACLAMTGCKNVATDTLSMITGEENAPQTVISRYENPAPQTTDGVSAPVEDVDDSAAGAVTAKAESVSAEAPAATTEPAVTAAVLTAPTDACTGVKYQRTSCGILHNEVMETYCNAILDQMEAVWPGAPHPATCFITPSSGLQAYSTRDGAIFIPYAILPELETKDALAALLAHEYSHIVLGHLQMDDLQTAMTFAQRACDIYMQYQGMQSGNVINTLKNTSLNAAALWAQQSALFPALTREQENEADQLGTDLMIRAGYNPEGMNQVLEVTRNWEETTGRIRAEQLAQMKEYIKQQSKEKAKTDGQLAAGLEGAFKTMCLDFGKVTADISRQHYTPEERIADFLDYFDQHYADRDFPPLDRASEAKLCTDAKVAPLLASLSTVNDFNADAPQDEKQHHQFMPILKAHGESVPWLRHMRIREVSAAAPSKKLLASLQKEVDRPGSLYSDHKLLIDALEKDSPKKALERAEATYAEFDHPNDMLPTLIRLNDETGNDAKTLVYSTQCLMLSDPELRDLCAQAQKKH